MRASGDVPTMVEAAGRGDRSAASRLAPLVYDELREVARVWLSRREGGAMMQTTTLLHEAYIRLLGASDVGWEGRAHFLAVGAKAIRQVLSNHIRDQRALKRGGGRVRLTFCEAIAPGESDSIDLVEMNEILDRLAEVDPRQYAVVEMRFFGGMSMDEIAHVLGLSLSTVEREWRSARAWLAVRLRGEEA